MKQTSGRLESVTGRLAGLLALVWVAGMGCADGSERLGGETNFVRECQLREDCGAGERCSERLVCEAAYRSPEAVPTAILADNLDGGVPDGPCLPYEPLSELDESFDVLSGEWTGALLGGSSLPGTPTVTLTVTTSPISGSLRLGDQVTTQPIMDPNVGYLVDSEQLDRPGRVYLNRVPLIAGFEYTIRSGRLASDEVFLEFEPAEPWAEWCEMQEPVDVLPEWENDLWSCARAALSHRPHELDGRCTGSLTDMDWFLETGGYRNDPDTVFEEDCGKAALCDIGVCECTADSCRAAAHGEVLQLRLTDDELEGTVSCGGTELSGLYLRLQRN